MISLIYVMVLLATIVAVVGNRKRESAMARIPGPKKLPVIENLHIFLGKSLPHHAFAELGAKYGPLVRVQLGLVPYLIVSSPEVVNQVVKTYDIIFANRPHFVTSRLVYDGIDVATAPYGDYWRQLKKICTFELLSMKRVKYFRPLREEENWNTAKWVSSNEGRPVNLSERIYQSSFDITSRATIGTVAEEKEATVTAIKEIAAVFSGLNLADFYPSNKLLPRITGISSKMDRIFRQTDRILDGIVEQHRVKTAVERREDLADILLKYQQDDAAQLRLTDDSIKAVLLDMFVAGSDTSAIILEWTMSEMIRNPAVMKKAVDEVRRVFDDKGCVEEERFHRLKYLKLVIKETMRLHPPLPLLFPRESSERCEINGYEIPAKTRVLINAWAMGRDPEYWSDAQKFMPERFEDGSIDHKGNNLEYIPFGAGRRICPGISFGLANVEFSLAVLLYHFDWKMPGGMKAEELDMTEVMGVTVRRKHSLLLIPTLKRPLQPFK